MAIRLAFLAVSNLPTGDMVLDEPGTALDEEHLQAFTQLLDMIKSYFKTMLISHLDSLKDVVDTTLDISKRRIHESVTIYSYNIGGTMTMAKAFIDKGLKVLSRNLYGPQQQV